MKTYIGKELYPIFSPIRIGNIRLESNYHNPSSPGNVTNESFDTDYDSVFGGEGLGGVVWLLMESNWHSSTGKSIINNFSWIHLV